MPSYVCFSKRFPVGKGALNLLKLIANYIQNVRDVPNAGPNVNSSKFTVIARFGTRLQNLK
jgi:hypothetical protein